jgi:hypothetical protein
LPIIKKKNKWSVVFVKIKKSMSYVIGMLFVMVLTLSIVVVAEIIDIKLNLPRGDITYLEEHGGKSSIDTTVSSMISKSIQDNKNSEIKSIQETEARIFEGNLQIIYEHPDLFKRLNPIIIDEINRYATEQGTHITVVTK